VFASHKLADVLLAPQVSRYEGGDCTGACVVTVLTVTVPASDQGVEVAFEQIAEQ
jgi:hypothetical protein